jgi:hypothetical protein
VKKSGEVFEILDFFSSPPLSYTIPLDVV